MSDVSDATDASDTTYSLDLSDPSDGTAVFLRGTNDCPQIGYFLDAGQSANYVDYNGDGQTNAEYFDDTSIVPTIDVSCDSESITVSSNGVINFDYVIGGGNNPSPQVNDQDFVFPRNPAIANATSDLPFMGLVAVMINGVQIFGPNELLSDNGADPYLHGLLGYCGGHVHTYHAHSFPECFYAYETLSDDETYLLEEGLPGQVLGYAMDGFPILAPYECVDATCSAVLPVASAWDYDESALWTIDARGVSLSGDCLTDDEGGYSDNYAWDCNVYAAKSDTDAVLYADECNGRERPDGTYAYYATRTFPYYLGCYTGTASSSSGPGGGSGPSGGNGNGGPPPGGAETK